MFKPVTGSDLSKFDDETRDLFARKDSDWRITDSLLKIPRTTRNYLPIVAKADHPYYQEKEAFFASLHWKLLAGMTVFGVAPWQFSKAYYPFGIVLRRSIPTTPLK